MEKMREEFESWWRSRGHQGFMKKENGEYGFAHAETAWQAWKASRAELCVELPKTPSFSASDEPDLAFEYGVDVMKDIIEAAGVTCK